MDQVDQVVCHHGVQDLDQWEDLQESGAPQEGSEDQGLEVQDLEDLVDQEMEAGAAAKKNPKLLRRLKLTKLT